MRVMKFGGTSVGSADAIRATCLVIKGARRAKPVVIVSALAGVTNGLLKIAHEKKTSARLRHVAALRQRHAHVLAELRLPNDILDSVFAELETVASKTRSTNKKTVDTFLSFGERFSARIVAACLKSMDVQAQSFDAWEIGMVTDERFGEAEPLSTATITIRQKIRKIAGIPVITGFIGKTRRGEITTLGRGGSDYTVAIIGAAIKAEAIEIWKDVDGFLTADPKIVHEARVVRELSYEEASELAYFGAKVVHPKTLLPAMRARVPVRILNTFKPKEKGTTIISNFEKRKRMSRGLDALTLRKNVAVIHVYTPDFFSGNEILSSIFKLFSEYHINIDVIGMSVASMSIVMDRAETLPREILKGLKKIGHVVVESEKAIICAVGGSLNAAEVAGRMFTVLGENKIPVELISQASSGYSIIFVVGEKSAERALKILHRAFIA